MRLPKRIQRSRAKGWRMPEGAVYVGRPTFWGNPHDWRNWRENAPRDFLPTAYEVRHWCRERAVQAFLEDIKEGLCPELVRRLPELRGKDLACWCRLHEWCHADILLKLANAPVAEAEA